MPKRDTKTHTVEKRRARRSAGSATGYLCPLCDQAYSTDVGIRRHAVRKHGMAWHSDGSVRPMFPAVISDSKNRLQLQQTNSKHQRKYQLILDKWIGEMSKLSFPDDVGSGSRPSSQSRVLQRPRLVLAWVKSPDAEFGVVR